MGWSNFFDPVFCFCASPPHREFGLLVCKHALLRRFYYLYERMLVTKSNIYLPYDVLAGVSTGGDGLCRGTCKGGVSTGGEGVCRGTCKGGVIFIGDTFDLF